MLVKNKYPLYGKNRNHIQIFSDISYSFVDQYLMFIGIQKMNKNYLKKTEFNLEYSINFRQFGVLFKELI